jgi:hypothetical protein
LAAAPVTPREVVTVAPDGLPAALAAKAATDSIPILFIVGGDPVSIDRHVATDIVLRLNRDQTVGLRSSELDLSTELAKMSG